MPMKVPMRGMPKTFAGIRASGRGKGHRRPWTAICSLGFLSIVFIVSSGPVEAKPVQKILRLGADQMQEILQYIHAQEREEKAAKGGGKEEEKLKEKPEEKLKEKPKEKLKEKPEEKPKEKPKEKPEEKREEKPEEKLEEEPKEKPEEKLEEKPEEKPWEKLEEKLEENPEEKPVFHVPLMEKADVKEAENVEKTWKTPKNEENWPEKQLEMEEADFKECQLDVEEEKRLQMRIRHFLHSQLRHIWSDQFAVQVLGLNVSIQSIRARAIRPPRVQLQAFCPSEGPSRLVATLSGGSLSLRASYRSVYRTVRTGHLRVRLGQFHGKLNPVESVNRPESQHCSDALALGHMDVRFRPRLLEEVDEAVADHLRDRVQHLICNRLQHFLLQNYRRR